MNVMEVCGFLRVFGWWYFRLELRITNQTPRLSWNMKRASNNSSSIINQRLRLIRYAVCTCGWLAFYKPKLFCTPSSERSCEIFPMWFWPGVFYNEILPFGSEMTVFLWALRLKRPVLGGGLKYYSRAFSTPTSFSWAVWQLWTWCPITGSQISEIGSLKWISHILPFC